MEQLSSFWNCVCEGGSCNGKSVAKAAFVYATKSQRATRQSQQSTIKCSKRLFWQQDASLLCVTPLLRGIPGRLPAAGAKTRRVYCARGVGHMFPSKVSLPVRDMDTGPHLIHDFLGPREFVPKLANGRFSVFAHPCSQHAHRPHCVTTSVAID